MKGTGLVLLLAGRLLALSPLALALDAAAQARQNPVALPPQLQGCAAIFEPVGIPSGVDGADDRTYIFAKAPVPAAPEPNVIYRCHLGGFALRLNGTTKVPDWVAEDITLAESAGGAERSNAFFVDQQLPSGYSALPEDYKASGYDRGHQAPAGDFSADQPLMDETFVFSNMGPQVGRCFNQGIWRNLEMAVRSLTPTRGRLIVFTGPIFDLPLHTIADEKAQRQRAIEAAAPPAAAPATPPPEEVKPAGSTSVPDAFFKIVFDPAGSRAMAFRFKNEARCKTSYADAEFRTTIDAIEEETGFDFLPDLPHREQKLLESQISPFWTW